MNVKTERFMRIYNSVCYVEMQENREIPNEEKAIRGFLSTMTDFYFDQSQLLKLEFFWEILRRKLLIG